MFSVWSPLELQLAALLGKTLLEKNGELEIKLRKLQEFAEETLATNQVGTIPTIQSRSNCQGRSQVGGGGSLGCEETPPPPPPDNPKGPLECTKRSTITICLVNIDLDTIEDLNKLLSNQLGHA